MVTFKPKARVKICTVNNIHNMEDEDVKTQHKFSAAVRPEKNKNNIQ